MTLEQIPDEMTAVVLDSYTGVEGLRVERRPVPRPKRNQVLVKIAAAPINPSDLLFVQGRYGFTKPTPVVPGFESAGTVIAAGGGLMSRYLLGRRVACLSQQVGDGVWAEYTVTSTNTALPLDAAVSLEQGAMGTVNPLTASAFLEIAQQDGHKAIVQTAAASALGQMLIRLCQDAGIQVINIVRRDTQVELLKQVGATLVLNSSDADFDQQLRAACQQHNARLAFDAVAGLLTLQLLAAMPHHSKVTVYGDLSAQPAQASPKQLIFEDKAVDGFWLGPWLARKNLVQVLLLWRRTQKRLASDLKTEVRARYRFEDVREAIADYQSGMTGGKILLTPKS